MAVTKRSQWKMQLIAPSGKVFDMGEMGYAASTQEHSYVMPQIVEFLKNSNYTNTELILESPTQALLHHGFWPFHGYRLVWGDADPVTDSYAAYPNGRDLNWKLYRLSNEQTEVYLEGSLPENWWEMSEAEQQVFLEQQPLEEGEFELTPDFAKQAIKALNEPGSIPFEVVEKLGL